MTVTDRTAARHAIPDLAFAITGVEPERYAAVPTLRFRLEITRAGGGPVDSVSLTTAILIDAARRRYGPEARRALTELFGEPQRWGSTMRPLHWARTTVVVPPFDRGTAVDITVPCPYDIELGVTKYLRAVRDGDVPLNFLFGGTVFFRAAEGPLRTAQISWTKDTAYGLPADLWHELIDRYFGGSPWLRLSRETYDRLDAFRAREVLGGWDDTIRGLLERAALQETPAKALTETRTETLGEATTTGTGAPCTP
ncbi:DUF6084 family protein [Streptomyces sp. 7N604]|uniref:DUF6084 family protein n=1 Tax=Streptomyces sp. 7N604 TaxID=3457415 RepID=UPI003FD2860E